MVQVQFPLSVFLICVSMICFVLVVVDITIQNYRAAMFGRCVIMGRMYTIFGSDLIQCLAPFAGDAFEMRRSKSGNFLKLRRQMVNAAKAGLVGNLRE